MEGRLCAAMPFVLGHAVFFVVIKAIAGTQDVVSPTCDTPATIWFAHTKPYVCMASPSSPAVYIRPEDMTEELQPASFCGVVVPPSKAEGWVWLRRRDADSVAFAVHVRDWPNTDLKAVHIHAGGPGVSFKGREINAAGSPVVSIVGGAVASQIMGPTWTMIQNGTFSSSELSGILTGKTMDDLFKLLMGCYTHTFANNLTVPIQGAYIVYHSMLHPIQGELRGDLQTLYHGIPQVPQVA